MLIGTDGATSGNGKTTATGKWAFIALYAHDFDALDAFRAVWQERADATKYIVHAKHDDIEDAFVKTRHLTHVPDAQGAEIAAERGIAIAAVSDFIAPIA